MAKVATKLSSRTILVASRVNYGGYCKKLLSLSATFAQREWERPPKN
ncbi:MAG: hypothetical protein RAK25_07195 [TACK group archaeon]|nr:hypothetical protein [TACK group archaeon]